jgi:hypothetical protein
MASLNDFVRLQLHVGQQYKKNALLHFHSKNCHANAQQYYVICTLPILFFISYIIILLEARKNILNNTVFHVDIQLGDTGLTAARECKIRADGRTGKWKT